MSDDTNSETEYVTTEAWHRFNMRKKDFTPQWSHEWVIPDNVLVNRMLKNRVIFA
jgi:hypothetical protein